MDEATLVAFGDESCKQVRDRATGKPLRYQAHVVAAMMALAGDIAYQRRRGLRRCR